MCPPHRTGSKASDVRWRRVVARAYRRCGSAPTGLGGDVTRNPLATGASPCVGGVTIGLGQRAEPEGDYVARPLFGHNGHWSTDGSTSAVQRLRSLPQADGASTPGHEKTLASQGNCPTGRLVHTWQPIFMNEYALVHALVHLVRQFTTRYAGILGVMHRGLHEDASSSPDTGRCLYRPGRLFGLQGPVIQATTPFSATSSINRTYACN